MFNLYRCSNILGSEMTTLLIVDTVRHNSVLRHCHLGARHVNVKRLVLFRLVHNMLHSCHSVKINNYYEDSNTVTGPTRTTDTSSTLLDVILTTHPQRFCYTKTLQLGISDHDMVVTIRKWKLPKPPPKLISYCSMKRFDAEIFLQDLNSVPWDSAFIYDDIDDI